MFRHEYVVCLCLVCILWQFSTPHDMQFVKAGRGCKRRPYGRDILQSWSHNCLIGVMSASFCLPHLVAVSVFIISRGLCACTKMLWMCGLYVSFGSKVRPRTFGCVDIVVYFQVQIARIFCRVRREQSASCFVWI